MRSPRLSSTITPIRAIVASLAFTSILAGPATAQDKQPLARRVPGTDLVAYLEFDGLDAHAKEWKASAAYKALNETSLGALFEDLVGQGLDLAMKNQPNSGAQTLKALKFIANKGMAVSYNGKSGMKARVTIVFRGGTSPEIYSLLKNVGKPTSKTTMRGTRKVTTHDNGVDSGAIIEDGGDLILADLEFLEPLMSVLDGKTSNASANPIYVELSKPEGNFKPIAIVFADMKAAGPLPPPAAGLGLDGLNRVDFRWGTNGPALYSVLRLMAPAPRKGVLALLDGATFDKSSLPPIPANVGAFTAMSLSPGLLYDKAIAIYKQVNPAAGQQVEAIQGMVDQQLGAKLKQDLLGKLGPKWSVFQAPADAPGGLPFNVAVIADLADPAKFATSLSSAMNLVNAQLQAAGGPKAPQRQAAQFYKLDGNQVGYQLVLPTGTLPPGPMSALNITIMIGKKSLAIGSTTKTAATALALADGTTGRWKPDADYTKALETVPKGLVFLNVSDPRKTLPQLISNLPVLLATANLAMSQQAGPKAGPAIPIQIDPTKIPKAADLASKLFPSYQTASVDSKGITFTSREALPSLGNPAVVATGTALLLPAVQAAREAARRTQCVNNLKQIALAFVNHDTSLAMFPGDIVNKQGKPLLSWRVAILPFIQQQTLYNKFKLDEPWDSPNNKPLLEQMPKIFACPSHAAEPGLTHYQGWSGPKTFFENPKKPATMKAILDGTSLTIAVAESTAAVPWTKPEELPIGGNLPLLGAGSPHPGGFNAMFVDGSVRFIKLTIDPTTFKALLTIDGGEVVNPGGF